MECIWGVIREPRFDLKGHLYQRGPAAHVYTLQPERRAVIWAFLHRQRTMSSVA